MLIKITVGVKFLKNVRVTIPMKPADTYSVMGSVIDKYDYIKHRASVKAHKIPPVFHWVFPVMCSNMLGKTWQLHPGDRPVISHRDKEIYLWKETCRRVQLNHVNISYEAQVLLPVRLRSVELTVARFLLCLVNNMPAWLPVVRHYVF